MTPYVHHYKFVCICLVMLSPSPSGVEVLLAAGAAVDFAAAGGQTPLFLACEAGRLDCVQVLLNAGADRSRTTTVSLCHRGITDLIFNFKKNKNFLMIVYFHLILL